MLPFRGVLLHGCSEARSGAPAQVPYVQDVQDVALAFTLAAYGLREGGREAYGMLCMHSTRLDLVLASTLVLANVGSYRLGSWPILCPVCPES